jgi:hypothetical protein
MVNHISLIIEELDLGFAEFVLPEGPGRPYTALTQTHVEEQENAAELSTRRRFENLERETGLEPATLSLGSSSGDFARLSRCVQKRPGSEGLAPFQIPQMSGLVS